MSNSNNNTTVRDMDRAGWRIESPNSFAMCVLSETYWAVPKHSLVIPDGPCHRELSKGRLAMDAHIRGEEAFSATIAIDVQVTGDKDMPEEVRTQICAMVEEIKDAIEHAQSLRGETTGTHVAGSISYLLSTLHTGKALKRTHDAAGAAMDEEIRAALIDDAEEHGIDGRLERVRAGDEAPEA